jgi:MFS family permease
MTHGRIEEAEAVMAEIERRVGAEALPPPAEADTALITPTHVSLAIVARTLLRAYPARTLLGIVLMASQAFFYNAIFFTYALVLTRFFAVPADRVGLYILPFALGNFAGPLLLGPLFDTLGRKPMIAATYAIAGALLALSGLLFVAGLLDARTQTLIWTIVFFFASAAASAAYLTVGESFPLELRALAIALFYAFGTLIGGVGGPALFGALIARGGRGDILVGYLLGAALMLVAAAVELKLGVAAERRPLEEVAVPLSLRRGVE